MDNVSESSFFNAKVNMTLKKMKCYVIRAIAKDGLAVFGRHVKDLCMKRRQSG